MAKKKAGNNGFYLQVIWLAVGAFLLSFAFNLSLENASRRLAPLFSLPLLFLVVLLGVASDVVGIASARAKEESLLSMASRRVAGAREAVWFVRNAPRVSSVFSDLMGDVSATLAGALVVGLVVRVRAALPRVGEIYSTSIAVGVASLLSVGGKALFKPLALKYAENVILFLGKIRRLWLIVIGGRPDTR